MKIKVLIGILIFLIVLNLATIGTWLYFQFAPSAHFEWRPIPMKEAPMRFRMRPPIHDLTPEQRQQLRQLVQEMRQIKGPIEKQLQSIHNQLRTALTDTAVTIDSLRMLLDSLANIQRQLNDITIHYFLSARQFLTPQQRQRIFQHLFFQSRRQHRKIYLYNQN